jgi:prepilin-type N-terminal cleavage/methylation domain-containing protein
MMRRCPNRRGFTLLELLAVMSIFAVLMALTAMLMSAMLQTQRQTMLRERQRLEYLRLDSILRTDAHAASDVTLKSPTNCELKNGEGDRWIYHAEEEGLVRERFLGEKRVQREVFWVRPGTKIKFRVANEHDRSLLQLELDPPSQIEKSGAHQAPYRGQVLVGGAIPTGLRAASEVQP